MGPPDNTGAVDANAFAGKVMDLTGKTEGRQTAECEKKLRLFLRALSASDRAFLF